jgi:ferredoxin-NADP reductase
MRALVTERRGVFHEIVGPRQRVRVDRAILATLAPRLNASDVYICGPSQFTADVVSAAVSLGVPETQIHQEEFAF